jgi:uncharacterized protein
MGNNYNTMPNNATKIAGLFSKTRQSVLALLYGQTDRSFYTKQVLDAVNIGRGTVQRELKNLTAAGIILREMQGRQVYYRANEDCPVFHELHSLVTKMNRNPWEGDVSLDVQIQQRFVLSQKQLVIFCRKHHIKKLSLFGSVLRADYRPDSDIDILVEFENGYVPGFGIVAMQNELISLAGRKIDLRTPADLSRHFRSEVVREARVQYEQTRS